MRRRLAAVALLGLLLVTGCDRHEAALSRPAGESLERIRMATIDVVLDKGYAILDAPLCRRADGAVTCKGTTVDGQDIDSTSPRDAREDVTVMVGTTRLYDGAVRDVLEDAARAP